MGTEAFVPGMMRCAKCNFVLQRAVMHAHSGDVSAGGNQTEPCPNGCGPLWPISWRQNAEELQERAEQLLARAVAAEARAATMEAALEPFARIASGYDPQPICDGGAAITYPDDECIVLICAGDFDPDWLNNALKGTTTDEVQVGDLRRARSAFSAADTVPARVRA